MKRTITRPLTTDEQAQVTRHAGYLAQRSKLERQARVAMRRRDWDGLRQIGDALRALATAELQAAA